MMMIPYVLLSFVIAWLGRNYRFGFWGYFFASLFFTPPVGAVMVIAAMPSSPPDQDE
jgi:hypothetical protein